MKKYLTIVCTGNNTYHDFSDKEKRNFDVCIIYFNEGKEEYFQSQCEYYFKKKSPKYKLIKETLSSLPWDKYKYIFLPDDDLKISIEDINLLFETAHKSKIELCQPSILLPKYDWKECQKILQLLESEKDQYSVTPLFDLRKKYPEKQSIINGILYGCSYPFLLKKYEDNVIRSTNFIEVQCPLLSVSFLKKIYNVLMDDLVTTGFGIDQVWSQPGIVKNKYVIDFISAVHMNETHFRQYEEFIKGKRKEDDVAEQYRKLTLNPMVEAKNLLEKYSKDNLLITNESFEFYMDNYNIKITCDQGGYETRNNSMIKLITNSYNMLIKGKIKKYKIEGKVYTGDKYKEDINAVNSFAMAGTKDNYNNLIPPFIYDSWEQVGIYNYEDKISSILKASEHKWSDKRVFWIGNCNSNVERWKYIDYSKKHSDKTLFEHIYWTNGTNKEDDMSKITPNFISLEEHTKYRVLLDGIPNGYSGRLPFILSTGRPVIIHERPYEEWFFYNDTFKPWVHYIPLKNISELDKIINWTFDNQEECDQIGKRGQEYVQKYLTYEKIMERFAEVLISKKQKRHSIDPVLTQIKFDNCAFKYSSNMYAKMDIALKSTFKLNHHILKIKIENNKMTILNKVKAYQRREEGLIKIVQMALKYGKIRDGIIYMHVADEYIYQYPELPFMIIAKPENKNGILIPDNTFVDIEPEAKTAIDNNKMINWDENKNMVDEKCNKINKVDKQNKIFFIGQNINMKKTEFNMRKWLFDNQHQFKNLEILLNDKNNYVPVSDFCKYKYLLNLPGMSPWSFRFKFLFLMKSLVINVALLRKYSSSYDKKWINIFDPMFIKNKDYIEIDFEFGSNKSETEIENSLDNLLKNIVLIYNKFEQNQQLYDKIVANGYKKGEKITKKLVAKIAYNIINNYCTIMENNNVNDFKYKGLNYNLMKSFSGKINNVDYKLVGKGVQGNVYILNDYKNKFKWAVKATKLTFGKYDSYREAHFSEMTNTLILNNKNCGFLKYYITEVIDNTSYISMEYAYGDVISWASISERSIDDWKSLIFQVVIAIINLQKLKIIHNDLQPKNILYNNSANVNIHNIQYKIKNKKYNFKTKYVFYVSDFGIAAHPDLEINLLSKEQMNIQNYDIKKFSQTDKKLKAICIKTKYDYNKLIDKFKKLNDDTYVDKIDKLQNKVKGWQLSKNEKDDYIHLHLAYYYIKKGYFDNKEYDDIPQNINHKIPKKIPDEIIKMFNELKMYVGVKKDLNDWLEKYLE